jgi:hypothetical protein
MQELSCIAQKSLNNSWEESLFWFPGSEKRKQVMTDELKMTESHGNMALLAAGNMLACPGSQSGLLSRSKE